MSANQIGAVKGHIEDAYQHGYTQALKDALVLVSGEWNFAARKFLERLFEGQTMTTSDMLCVHNLLRGKLDE